jgi:hypothetical protein
MLKKLNQKLKKTKSKFKKTKKKLFSIIKDQRVKFQRSKIKNNFSFIFN